MTRLKTLAIDVAGWCILGLGVAFYWAMWKRA